MAFIRGSKFKKSTVGEVFRKLEGFVQARLLNSRIKITQPQLSTLSFPDSLVGAV